jgi:hypothetical protein
MSLTVVNISICVIFLIISAFWLGKKVAQCKIFKLEKSLNEAEYKFKKISETFDEVVEFHISNLTKKTDDLKELLMIADKKCLLVNDLLSELEELREEIKKRNMSPDKDMPGSLYKTGEKRLKKEFDETFEEIKDKILALNGRTGALEDQGRKLIKMIENETNKKNMTVSDVKDIVNTELNAYLSALELGSAEVSAGEVEKAETENVPEPGNGIPAGLLNKIKNKNNDGAKYDKNKDLPYPAPDILRMHKSGIVVPQIAKNLKIGIGEVELILALYGENVA